MPSQADLMHISAVRELAKQISIANRIAALRLKKKYPNDAEVEDLVEETRDPV